MTNPATNETVEIYHIEGRRSFRLIWLCEELGIPYQLKFVRGDIMASLGLMRKDYPLLPMCPVVRIRNEWMIESGAIMDVLLEFYGKGRMVPARQSADFMRHTQWMHFAEATAFSRFLLERFQAMALGVDVTTLPRGYQVGDGPDAMNMIGSAAVLEFVDDYLSKFPYFGGQEFSAADINMQYTLRGAKLLLWRDLKDYRHIKPWKEKVEARAAFKRAWDAALPDGGDEYGLPIGSPLPFPPPPEKAAAR